MAATRRTAGPYRPGRRMGFKSGHFLPGTRTVAHPNSATAVAICADERGRFVGRLTLSAEHEHRDSIVVRGVHRRAGGQRRAYLAVFVYERQEGGPDSTVDASMRGRPLASRMTRRLTSNCSCPAARLRRLISGWAEPERVTMGQPPQRSPRARSTNPENFQPPRRIAFRELRLNTPTR
jgi:hypothetical protein